jgi:hypothetical protein
MRWVSHVSIASRKRQAKTNLTVISIVSVRDADLRAHELDLVGHAGRHQVVDGERPGDRIATSVAVEQVGTVGKPVAANGGGAGDLGGRPPASARDA